MAKKKLYRLTPLDEDNPIERIDWKLLKKQKATLVKMSFDPKKYNLTYTKQVNIEGIIGLLDSIQDYAIDVLKIPKKKVLYTPKEKSSKKKSK